MMTQKNYPPQLGDEQVKLLERLSNACAVSGDEGEGRKIVLGEVRPHADDVRVDALGNVLVTRHGQGDHPLRVMLAAHMDEVGLMITHDEGEGIYRFEPVGGLAAADLAAKTMWVGKEHIPGVIGLNPIHLSEDDEIKRHVSMDNLRLDVGPAAGKVRVGS